MRHSREEVIGRVIREFELLDRLVSGFTDEDWERPAPRPETKDPWTVKDSLAHITYWKANTTRVIRKERRPAEERGLEFHEMNRLIWQRWRDRSPQEVLDWHRQVQQDLLAALNEAPDEWFGGKERGEPWPFDVDGHSAFHRVKDLEAAVKAGKSIRRNNKREERHVEYRRLGRTGLKVSELCLGTMQWGWTADEATAFEVMDAFVAAGGNFIDTADVYSRWAPGNPGGVSEEIIGRWMKARGNRQDIVLATKARGRMWEGPNGEGLSRGHLMRAVDDSLRRLQTDYIDLYQTHADDREVPFDETLRALDDMIRAGKVRYIGASNIQAWRLCGALWTSEKHGIARYDSLQPHYNLAHRAEFERELKPLCEDQGIGVIPYSPLAAGFLTGKYQRGTETTSARAEGIKNRYFDDRGWCILDKLQEVARGRNLTPTATALAWLLGQKVIASPIIGANSVEQLSESLAASGVKLSDEEMAGLNEASKWE